MIKFLNRRTILGLLFAQSGFIFAQAQDPSAKLDEYLKSQHERGQFTGNVLVAQGGKVLYNKGFGMADYAKNLPLTPQTKFRTGSVTKQFTATLIMQLAEQGKLQVQDPVSRFVPGFPNGDKITIHHLLTHTSGLPNYTALPQYSSFKNKPLKPLEILAFIQDKPLEFEPGSTFSYSNSGYALLGVIIEKAGGKPYATLLEENILKPAGMTDSGVEKKGVTYPDFAVGYASLTDKAPVDEIDPGIANAAGSIYSTVLDLYKWHQALLTNKIVQAGTLAKMYTPFKAKYAYGWGIDSLDGQLLAAHSGGIDGFRSNIARVPSRDFVVIMLCNMDSPAAGVLARDLLHISTGKAVTLPEVRVRKAITLPESVLQQYVGEYEITPTFTLKVTVENGKLITQATGQPKFEVFPETEKDFFVTQFDAQLTFVKDESGKVSQVILHQGGRDTPAKKL